MSWSDWVVVGVLAAVYVGLWAAYLVHIYRYIRDCPVPLWSNPRMECFQCPHADRCGRASPLCREWGGLYKRLHGAPGGADLRDQQ